MKPLHSLSAATRLWAQLALSTAVALVLFVALPVPSPRPRMPLTSTFVAGQVVGVVLYLALARNRPFLPSRRRRTSVIVAKYALIGVFAASEEVLWRRILLGECLRVSVIAAIAGSTLAFAVAHRVRPGVHLVTGAAFGGVYVVSGALAASIAAHWAYNALLAALADRARSEGGALA